MVADVGDVLARPRVHAGSGVLFEGAQGTLLDSITARIRM